MAFNLTPATGQPIQPPAEIDVLALDFIVNPLFWTVSRGAGENSHIVTLRAMARTIYLFLETFTGAALTKLSSHTPDIAPTGFAYAKYTDNECQLVGDGTARAEGEAVDAFNNSSASSPPLAITLPTTYSIELTGRPSEENSESVYFVISTGIGADDERFKVGVGRGLGGGMAYKVFVEWRRSGYGTGFQTYPVPDNSEVLVRVDHTPTSFTVFINGSLAAPDSGGAVTPTLFSPITNIADIGWRMDAGAAFYSSASRAAIFYNT